MARKPQGGLIGDAKKKAAKKEHEPQRPIIVFSSLPDPVQAAASYVQKKWRSRKTRKLLAMFPSMRQLESMYIDEAALAAGAGDNPLYSSRALKTRELIYHTPEVQAGLTFAWRAVAYRKGELALVKREDYLVMMRKLYLALKDDAELDPSDCFDSASEDWEADAKNQQTLGEEEFKRCWFQLADVYTESLHASDYADWLRDTVCSITKPAQGSVNDPPDHQTYSALIAGEAPAGNGAEVASALAGAPTPASASADLIPQTPSGSTRNEPRRVWRTDAELLVGLRSQGFMTNAKFGAS